MPQSILQCHIFSFQHLEDDQEKDLTRICLLHRVRYCLLILTDTHVSTVPLVTNLGSAAGAEVLARYALTSIDEHFIILVSKAPTSSLWYMEINLLI